MREPFSSSPSISTGLREEALIKAVRRIFPSAKVSITNQIDYEEGWTRPLLRVETGITDLDELDELEQKFYEEVERQETLVSALNSTTVFFV